MSDDGMNDWLSYACVVEKQTEKAIRASVEGKDEWYPKSQLDSWPPIGQRGTIVMPRWLALNNGLPDPGEQQAAADVPPSEDWRSDADERPSMDTAKRIEVFERDQAAMLVTLTKCTSAMRSMADALERARGHIVVLTKRLNELEGVDTEDNDEHTPKY